MDFKGIKYEFVAKPWQYTGQGAWIFVSLPSDLAKEIRHHFKSEEEGWGRLKVTAQLGKTEWKTAIWFDKKADTYLLPLKSDIRKKENIIANNPVKVSLWI